MRRERGRGGEGEREEDEEQKMKQGREERGRNSYMVFAFQTLSSTMSSDEWMMN